MATIVSTIGVVSSGLAAALWLRAALIVVPDNIDTFIAELKRAGRWNAAGAIAACIAFVCQTYLFALALD